MTAFGRHAFNEPVAVLLAEMGYVDYGKRIGGFHRQQASGRKLGQTLACLQRRQRAFQPLQIIMEGLRHEAVAYQNFQKGLSPFVGCSGSA